MDKLEETPDGRSCREENDAQVQQDEQPSNPARPLNLPETAEDDDPYEYDEDFAGPPCCSSSPQAYLDDEQLLMEGTHTRVPRTSYINTSFVLNL